MKIQPLFDRVLIAPDEGQTTTKSGIVLPETGQERPQTGTIVAVGNGNDFDNNNIGMLISVGDKVLYHKYSGTEIKVDNKNYLVLRQIDVIAIIKD